MICDNISTWKPLKISLSPALSAGLAWIEKNKDVTHADATIPLENGMRVIVQSYDPKTLAGGQFENHHKFIDIQYVVQGAELIYWTKPRKLPVAKAYSGEKDIEFFDVVDPVANSTGILLEAGMFAILWPGDWHLPCINPAVAHASYSGVKGKVKKFVVKVPA
jgi:biofilm protein TabA